MGNVSLTCISCGAEGVRTAIDFGEQAVASHFSSTPDAQLPRHRLAMGICEACGLVQLTPPWPSGILRSCHDWITAREPESHLDAVVARTIALLSPPADALILGLTDKDDTTLARFRALGYANTRRLDPATDLGIDDPRAGLETIQLMVDPERMAAVAARYGAADLLVARHVLEHAEDVRRFGRGLAAALRPGGAALVECPDSTDNFERFDYTAPWEEHALYLTAGAFAQILAPAGFTVEEISVHPFSYENSLIQIARLGADGRIPSAAPRPPPGDLERFSAFARAFPERSRHIRDLLEAERAKGKIALYGAGHLACAFVNHHGVADLITCVVDDTERKQGLFLPGSGLPISPSAALLEKNIRLCLLCLSIEIEDKVVARNAAYSAAGGRFLSIFPGSGRSLLGFAKANP